MTSGCAATTAELFASGGCIGEIVVRRNSEGFEIRHRDDEHQPVTALEVVAPEAAIVIAKYDHAGVYRPLKTAPNLRHGWRISCASTSDVIGAVEQIYPGRLAALRKLEAAALVTTALRETLNRQSGMYKVAARISDDEINDLVAGFCRSDRGCLRTIFWRRDVSGAIPSTKLPAAKYDAAFDQTGRGERSVPLVCQEACNLLVNAAREWVKRETPR